LTPEKGTAWQGVPGSEGRAAAAAERGGSQRIRPGLLSLPAPLVNSAGQRTST
jgi:hypothetical protein